jgi:N-hydroxyarylamine O-acetyltransferase
MSSQDGAPQIGGALLERVLERLGFCAAPSADLAGLRAVYSAWCGKVPFDNGRKMIALRAQHDLPLPGGDAEQFFETWLAHGTGGTCWPSSSAVYELVQSLGFEGAQPIQSAPVCRPESSW